MFEIKDFDTTPVINDSNSSGRFRLVFKVIDDFSRSDVFPYQQISFILSEGELIKADEEDADKIRKEVAFLVGSCFLHLLTSGVERSLEKQCRLLVLLLESLLKNSWPVSWAANILNSYLERLSQMTDSEILRELEQRMTAWFEGCVIKDKQTGKDLFGWSEETAGLCMVEGWLKELKS